MKIITSLLLLVANVSFAQGLILSTIPEKPEVLTLEVIRPWSGESYLAHVEDNPSARVKTVFMGDQLLNLQNHLLQVNSQRIFCDGEYAMANDFHGMQFIALGAINVCIDQDGWVVAHSVNKTLTQNQISEIAGELSQKIQKKEIGGAIYQGDESKDFDHSSVSSSSNVKSVIPE